MAIFSIEGIKGDASQKSPRANSETNTIEVGSYWVVRFNANIAAKTEHETWSFVWFGESGTQPDLHRISDLLDSGHFQAVWGLRGVLIAICQRTCSIYLFNDAYGAYPVFVNDSWSADEPLVSDSLRPFLSHETDWSSVYQFLSFGYIFAPYSLFHGISRLGANGGLKIHLGSDRPALSQFPLSNFWLRSNEFNSGSVDDCIDIFREEAKDIGNVQLMMSGGWDSRLLLSVLEQTKPTLFSHGNLGSREIAIVRDIAANHRLSLVERSFSPRAFDLELFNSYLDKNESAMFTHWDQAGAHAQENSLIMMAGTFGEVLGGHYGTLNTLPGKRKHLSLLMHMLGAGAALDNAYHLHDQDTVLAHLKMHSYKVFWFMNSNLLSEICKSDLIGESNTRLKKLFESYRDQGMTDAQSMFERFYTEHRGGQYINLQVTNSARGYKYRNIFTNKNLIETVSSIPFSHRAHNKLNRHIIKKLNPKLLDYPMAATLANAGRPLLIQEASRAVRKVIEAQPALASMYRKVSRYGDRSFGWNDFSEIVDEKWIESLMPLLSEELWDRSKLVHVVESDYTSNMYPLFDMVSKAVTLNYLLAGCRS